MAEAESIKERLLQVLFVGERFVLAVGVMGFEGSYGDLVKGVAA
jgi:hypothetical protein